MRQNATAIPAEIPSAGPCGSTSPRVSRQGAHLALCFDRLRSLLEDLGPEFTRDEHRLGDLRKRLDEGRFHLAVLGQFKRGKSTLLNALLGGPLLPTSVVPLTAIPTFLRAGRQWQAKVAYTDGHPGEQVTGGGAGEVARFLAEYVTEADIPYHEEDDRDLFELPEQPYWVTDSWDSHLGPLSPEFLDKFLPARFRRARVRQRLMARVEKLVLRNVEDLRWPTLQTLERAFREFGADLDNRLKETITATHGAIRAAQSRRQEHADTVAAEIERLEGSVKELNEIQSTLGRITE